MSTFTRLTFPSSSCKLICLRPPLVSMVSSVLSVSPRSYTYLPTQRMPLPHMPASLPSELKIRMPKSAVSLGSMRIRPSLPQPKWGLLITMARRSGSDTTSSKQFT